MRLFTIKAAHIENVSLIKIACFYSKSTIISACALTSNKSSFVCAADKHILARDSMMGVAGKPTTTVAKPYFKHSLLKALLMK